MKLTSHFALTNLKEKFKEKFLNNEINPKKEMNDTVIIRALENKIKIIYQRLNLNTEELVHLKKITTNADEYIVFMKILIDKLNSVRKMEEGNKNKSSSEINYVVKNDKEKSSIGIKREGEGEGDHSYYSTKIHADEKDEKVIGMGGYMNNKSKFI